MELLETFRAESTMVPDQAEVMIRRFGSETLKDAAFICTAERFVSKLMRFPNSKWSELKMFTVSNHAVSQVEKRLDIPGFNWDSHLCWAQESLCQWVLDGILPDLPPYNSESPHIALRSDPSLPEAIADKEARVLATAAIRASLKILDYINFQSLSLKSIEYILGLSESEATQNLSQIQKVILGYLQVKTDALVVNRGKTKGWLDPWERAVEWDPWEEFTRTEWFRESTPSKRAVLSRSLKNLEERGLILRQSDNTKPGRKKPSNKRTTHIELTELGYIVAKMLTTQT